MSKHPEKPFHFKPHRQANPLKAQARPPQTHHGEVMTGFVQGQQASSLEERFARALDRAHVNYVFQMVLDPGQLPSEVKLNLPGELTVDFVIMRGGVPSQPIQIDGQIAHYRSDWQRLIDTKKDAGVNDVLQSYGAQPVIRIPFEKIATPDMTDALVRQIAL